MSKQNRERIAVVSLNPVNERVRVHEFEGEYRDGTPFINLYGLRRSQISGMPVTEFLEFVLLSPFEAPWNKHVACTKLNTWFWAAVVGDNGGMRGRPAVFRHTMPGSDTGIPFWILKKKEGRGYSLKPFKGQFECRYCGKEFERYSGQTEHDECADCAELKAEMVNLAFELYGEETLSVFREEEIKQRISEINKILVGDDVEEGLPSIIL